VELEGPEEIIELLRGSEELQEKIVNALPRGADGHVLPEYQDQKDEPWHEYILRIKKKFEDEGIEFATGGKVGSLMSAMDAMDRSVATGKIIPKEPERISPRRQRTEEEPIDAFNYTTRSPHAQQIDGLLKRYQKMVDEYNDGTGPDGTWTVSDESLADEEAAEILDELEDLDFDIDSIIFDS
jgi:hypothetical protein